MISPQEEVSVIGESHSETTETVQSTLHVKKGNNRIKIVTDRSAKFDIDISISQGELKELG